MKNKGITLIALVVTIVILVILGGVSVYLVLEQNGIISKAQFESNNYKQAEANEQIELAKMDNSIGEYIDGTREMSQEILNLISEKAKELNSISFNEKVIGTFADGKPLYQKTMVINQTADDLQRFPHNIENVDLIYIDLSNSFFTDETSGITSPFLCTGMNKGTIVDGYTKIIQNVDRSTINIRSCANAGSGIVYLTLRYTKTIDVAK